MKKLPLAHKILIPGRAINLFAKTDLAATFRRVKAEQAATAAEKKQKVIEIKRGKAK